MKEIRRNMKEITMKKYVENMEEYVESKTKREEICEPFKIRRASCESSYILSSYIKALALEKIPTFPLISALGLGRAKHRMKWDASSLIQLPPKT